MKDHQLSEEEITYLLENAASGVLGTSDADGSPYCVPVHFVYLDKKIYIHGLTAGEKTENIQRDPRVCFTVYRMGELLYSAEAKSPCSVNTAYQSVVVKGSAILVDDLQAKREILDAVVKKYTPQLACLSMQETAVMQTAVIVITPAICTGKYYL
ncbi:pyridoxamine 5'-phosphate oxidase-related, FMN-binding protein [Methanocorpusculum labreanum Z]|uniref:Pyridoxamine 5'-phosphate oxidase-related, FMN-binding protein n=2 Tax=Methanocorpusculum labreanum TaxID=83984 RepID=A2SS70_METLZ|nr:pyridoxamine 5'-phosphate oxidase-related, FMN-binding protein [Methanocorpusculum labreanum Z]